MSDDYEIGYGKPPKHSQFEPGKSGNPRGRPRGSRGLRTDLLAELSARQTIPLKDGSVMRGNRQQLMLRTLATRAAAGDLKAQALILPLIERALGIEDRSDVQQRLSAADQALLDQLLAPDPLPSASFDADGDETVNEPGGQSTSDDTRESTDDQTDHP